MGKRGLDVVDARRLQDAPVAGRGLPPAVMAVVAILLLLATFPGQASQLEKAQLQRIEAYLNGIRTVSSRFLQIASTGETAEGVLYLERPGRLRIEYAPPVPVSIYADGRFLVHYDKQLETASYVTLASTPAGILLQDKLHLTGGDIEVVSLKTVAGVVELTLERAGKAGEGRLTLVFSEEPFALRRWEVRDPQGVVTTVSLVDARFDEPLDREIFRFRDPEFFREPWR